MKFLRLQKIQLWAVAILAASGCTKEAEPMKNEISRTPLDCHLTWNKQRGGSWITVTYSNHDTRPAKIPQRWLFEGGEITWDAFQISCDGKAVPFVGRTVKRSEEDTFATIAPGEKLQVAVNLATGYRMADNCDYEIKLTGLYALAGDPSELLEINSDLLKKPKH